MVLWSIYLYERGSFLSENNETKKYDRITLGLLAHVDAGKTTLAEALLFLSGEIRTQGRVDKRDTFLDTDEIERKRGITVFSKQAEMMIGNHKIALLDTPGHTDFTSEAERTLSVLDYAILIVSASDGIQGHTLTLWSLLKSYNIPVFIFVNKTDISEKKEGEILSELKSYLGSGIVDLINDPKDNIAENSMLLLDEYLADGKISDKTIAKAIKNREIVPVYFGSALKLNGVKEFMQAVDKYVYSDYDENAPFSGMVYKITRDKKGERLTHLKVLKGSLRVKDEIGAEKVNQIRFYSGEKFNAAEAAVAGDVCTLTGLCNSFSGEIAGENPGVLTPVITPAMSYKLMLPEGTDVNLTYRKLLEIAEELPEISLEYLEETSEIMVRIMGEIQIEILKNIIEKRLSLKVEFGAGSIIYKETVSEISEGVGHFEPLRHYAEVHLKIEPGERNSGIQVFTDVSEDDLDRNWQRLIKTHIQERKHRGVLTGSLLTDVRIAVIGGRAHPKHTEGGDFRQASYRAVRHGLMMNKSVLLEPYYDFMLQLPSDKLGHAMTDITQMFGNIKSHEIFNDSAVIYGTCPVSTMHGYELTVNAYTKGKGRLSLSHGGYDICHNPEEVMAKRHYDPLTDIRNTPDSVFCANGSGFIVPWDKVTEYMHVPSCLAGKKKDVYTNRQGGGSVSNLSGIELDKELSEIFNRTYGAGNKKEKVDLFDRIAKVTTKSEMPEHVEIKETESIESYLLVDGYNIIFSWDELNELSKTNLEAARTKLIDILSNYQGFRKMNLILVFDAYKVSGGAEKVEKFNNIHVVYTKEAETADRYIERTTKVLVKKHNVTVATSDATEQVIIWGSGAVRISAREFREEIERTNEEIKRLIEK